MLRVVGVEVHDGKNAIGAVGRCFRVSDDLIVVGCVKAERPVLLQRRMRATDFVHAPDQLADVRCCPPVPRPVLIFLRVGVLF